MTTMGHQLRTPAWSARDVDRDCAMDKAARQVHLSRLVTRMAAGDRCAFAELVDATFDRLVAAIRLRLRDIDQAVEVANETFVEMWWMARHHVHTDSDHATAGWMVDIATRRAEDRLRPGRTAHAVEPSISPALVTEINRHGTKLMLGWLLGSA